MIGDFEDVKLTARPLPLFETPVVVASLANAGLMIADLKAAILEELRRSNGVRLSNEGGWHSRATMLGWGGPAAAKLAAIAVRMAKRMSHFTDADVEDFDWPVRMWANVTPKGGLNHMHAHPGNLWAAVFYIDMGADPGGRDVGGAFYVEDPRFPVPVMRHSAFRLVGVDNRPQAMLCELRPNAGDLLLFPAWLRHGVRPYTGEGERISIAMNIDAVERPRQDGPQ